MKYYIFGNRTDKTRITSSARKADYRTNNLDEALNVFQKYIREVRFTNIYLVLDFETKKRPIFSTESIENDFEDDLPFFIIGEWHVGDDPDLFIRSDHTEIEFGGFSHSFQNNLDALRLFLGFLENAKCPKFLVVYNKPETIGKHSITKQFRRKIADYYDLEDCIDHCNFPRPIRKVTIDSPDWDVNPITVSKFYNCVIEKEDTAPFKPAVEEKLLSVIK